MRPLRGSRGVLGTAVGTVMWALLLLVAPSGAAAQEPLTVYSSLPHVGATKAQSDDLVRAERMALDDAGGQAGGHAVRLVALNDGTVARGAWAAGRTAANARAAAADDSAIAYLGEFNSAATTISLPITNAAGILQVSPSNSYVGLTRSRPPATQPGEPGRFSPTGRRTFGRVSPADDRQADALARYLAELAIDRVALVDEAEIYGAGLAHLLRPRLRRRGIAVVRRATLGPCRCDVRRVVRRLRRVRADAMVYTGITRNGAVPLWRATHRAHRRWKLFGADGIAEPGFATRITRGAARRTYLTALPLAPFAYPPAGQDFFARFRARYGAEPDPYAIFGYEAMAVVLDSIVRATDPTSRQAVVDAFFATRDRQSVIGPYSIDAFGDTTLGTFGGYRIDARREIVWDRVLDIGPAA